ncbi:MAG TPA: alpha/beta hydrolase [Candidatus Cybelea sp.]|nr:alpha/beta hydrolase [Candidatus Cybelea sp.]
MDSKLIDVAEGRAKIRVYSGGNGQTMLFLHGAGGFLKDDPFLKALMSKYRVYAPLLPGYEDSEGADRLRDMLDVTLHSYDVMDALGLEKPIVVGHSMGGMIAAEMAAVAPRQIDRLALIAPAGLWIDKLPLPDIFAKLPFELPALLFHDVEFGTKLMTAGQNFDDMEFLNDFMIMNAKRLGMAGKLLFPIPDRGLADRLYRVRARTLVIWGDNDRLIPKDYGEAFKRQIKGSELVIVPKAGHLVGHEQPDAVLKALAKLG